jgi:hypothetical protein
VYEKIDSVTTVTINGVSLKKQFVSYTLWSNYGPVYYSSTIIEALGDLQFMFNIFPSFVMSCDMNYSSGLRCYDDNIIGHYETGIAPSCTYIGFVGVDSPESEVGRQIRAYPNPAGDFLNIRTEIPGIIGFNISDMIGKKVKTGIVISNQICIQELPQGMYFLEYFDADHHFITNWKVIKNN